LKEIKMLSNKTIFSKRMHFFKLAKKKMKKSRLSGPPTPFGEGAQMVARDSHGNTMDLSYEDSNSLNARQQQMINSVADAKVTSTHKVTTGGGAQTPSVASATASASASHSLSLQRVQPTLTPNMSTLTPNMSHASRLSGASTTLGTPKILGTPRIIGTPSGRFRIATPPSHGSHVADAMFRKQQDLLGIDLDSYDEAQQERITHGLSVEAMIEEETSSRFQE
jgi:hypothetical protein